MSDNPRVTCLSGALESLYRFFFCRKTLMQRTWHTVDQRMYIEPSRKRLRRWVDNTSDNLPAIKYPNFLANSYGVPLPFPHASFELQPV
jgi:hypothetical protein